MDKLQYYREQWDAMHNVSNESPQIVVYIVNDNHGINSHNTVTGNNNIIGNGNTVGENLSEQEKALFNIFKNLDIVKQAQLLAYAAELEREMKNDE